MMRLLPLVYLLVLMAPLGAQEGIRTVVLRTAALGILGERDTVWARSADQKEAVALTLNVRTFSTPVKLRVAGTQLPIYLERKDAEAKDAPPPSLTLTLSGDTGLLVLLPDKDRYRAFVVPGSEAPRDSYVLVNLSSSPLAWSVDGKPPMGVAPGGRMVHAVTPGTSTSVKIAMKLPDGSQRLVRNTVWEMGSGQREFILVHGTPDRPGFHHLVDSATEPAAP